MCSCRHKYKIVVLETARMIQLGHVIITQIIAEVHV